MTFSLNMSLRITVLNIISVTNKELVIQANDSTSMKKK